LLLKSGSRVQSLATLDAQRRAAQQRIQKLRLMHCSNMAAFDMSEAAHAEGGIVINGKRFDFETCEECYLSNLNVRLLSLHDAS
jgi:hypothetical protein